MGTLKRHFQKCMMKRALVITILVYACFSCSKNNSVENSVCTMAGHWRVTIDGDATSERYWDLYDNSDGSVSVVMPGRRWFFIYDAATRKFIGASGYTASYEHYEGSMNADCNEFEGTYTWENKGGSVIDTWSFKGVRN